MNVAGLDCQVIVGSDVIRDGMFLEVRDGEAQLLEVFYADESRRMTFTAYREDLPIALVEWALAEAKVRLPPAG